MTPVKFPEDLSNSIQRENNEKSEQKLAIYKKKNSKRKLAQNSM